MGLRHLAGSTIVQMAAMIAAVQFATFSVGIYLLHDFTSRTIIEDARQAALVQRDDLLDDFNDRGLAGMVEAIGEHMSDTSAPGFVVFVRRPDGERLVGNLRAWPTVLSDAEQWRVVTLYREYGRQPELMGVTTVPFGNGYVLLTGHVLMAERQLTEASERSVAYALMLDLAFSVVLAVVFSRLLAQRVDTFASAARRVETGELGARVRRSRSGDAFDRLAGSINAMLDRIQTLVRELRMVTDSMAHDLRTPVSRLKATLERGAAQSSDPAAKALFADAIDEADGLHAMLNTALEISRAEAGIGREQFSRFAIDKMLTDIAEIYGPLAEDHGVAIATRVPAGMTVEAHREMLMRAVTNLVDNALKYGTNARVITLAAEAMADGRLRLTVADDGPGIAEDQRALAVRRFGRLDPARTRQGAGLGLSLVETIAHLHGGTLELQAVEPHGLAAVLDLPVLAALPFSSSEGNRQAQPD